MSRPDVEALIGQSYLGLLPPPVCRHTVEFRKTSEVNFLAMKELLGDRFLYWEDQFLDTQSDACIVEYNEFFALHGLVSRLKFELNDLNLIGPEFEVVSDRLLVEFLLFHRTKFDDAADDWREDVNRVLSAHGTSLRVVEFDDSSGTRKNRRCVQVVLAAEIYQ